MRFHIGFSKRISLKKIIEFLGILFVGLLAFLGIYDKAHAEESWTNIVYPSSFITSMTGQILKESDNFQVPQEQFFTNSEINKRSQNYSPYGYSFSLMNQTNSYKYFNFATSPNSVIESSPPIPLDYVSTSLIFRFQNDNYCANNTTDLKSMNIKFPLIYNSFTEDYSDFNVSNKDELFEVRILAYNEEHQANFITPCTKSHIGSDDSYEYLITCNNVYQGNSNDIVSYFQIEVYNNLPFNNWYNANVSNKKIAGIIELGNNYSTYQNGIRYNMSYQCSSDPPNLDASNPDYGDDPGGLNDIYNKIKGDYDTELPGINTNLTLLTLPKTFTDLLLLPFDVVQAVVNNSSQCTAYEIDFSSIIHKWGSEHDDYVLRLPCMREVLSNRLGNWYIIADMLICFFVFYNITMYVINLISAITEGEDLFSYFFKPTHVPHDEYFINSNTGEVLYTRKGR